LGLHLKESVIRIRVEQREINIQEQVSMAMRIRDKFNSVWRHLPHPFRWVIVATVGSTLVFLGIVFMFIPGPGSLMIVLGVAILATEFAWAEVVYARIKNETEKFTARAKKAWKGKKK
jgi:uncharacterized protein (TIGR02611 family)